MDQFVYSYQLILIYWIETRIAGNGRRWNITIASE